MLPADPGTSGPEPTTPIGRIRLVLLALGLVAAFFSWSLGESIYRAFQPDLQYPADFNALNGFEKTRVRSQVRFRARVADERNKAMAAFGLLGVFVSSISLAGRIGRSGRPSRSGAFIGFAGGAAGAGLSLVLVPLFFEASNSQTGLPFLLLTHGAIFGVLGAMTGVGFALVHGDRGLIVRCMLGGVLGAFVGTFVAEVVNFAAFPLFRMYEPVPIKPLPRFLLNLFVAVGVALGIGFVGCRRKRGLMKSGS